MKERFKFFMLQGMDFLKLDENQVLFVIFSESEI